MLRRLLQLVGDAMTYGISGLLSQLLGLLLLPFFTRELGPSDYGTLGMLSFIPLVFVTLASAGTKTAVYNQFYKSDEQDRRRVVASTAAASVFTATLLVLALGLVAATSITQFLLGDDRDLNLVRLSLVSASLATLVEVPLMVLQADRRAKTVGLLNVIQVLVMIGATSYLVLVAKWGVLGMVVGGLIGAGVLVVLSTLAAARYYAPRIDLSIWRQIAAYALPFLPHRLQSMAMLFIGDYIIRTQLGTEELGLYTMAMRFAVPIVFLFGAFQQAWNPYKFKVFSEDPHSGSFFRSLLNYFVCVLAYLWLGISLWGPEALRLLTAPEFHTAAALIWATALTRAMQAYFPLMATGLELSTDTRAVPLVSFASMIVVGVGCWLMVPLFGAYGAALGTALGWATMAAGFFVIGQRQVPVSYDWGTIGAVVIVAAGFAVLGQFDQGWNVWWRCSVALLLSLCYPLACLLILYRTPSERHRIEILLRRLGQRGRRPVSASHEPSHPVP